MAHVKFEEHWYACAWENYRECEPYGEYCWHTEDDGKPCQYSHFRKRFVEGNYRKCEAWQDPPSGLWCFEARGETHYCIYLEIDGHVYFDNREKWNKAFGNKKEEA